MEAFQKLKLDYEQTLRYIHELASIRFKLLALIPIVTGATVSLLSDKNAQAVISISLLGLLVTIGIIFYDQRNTQLYNALHARARSLEVLLKLPPINNLLYDDEERQKLRYGGPVLDRPEKSRRFLGLFLMWHNNALALIYSAVIGAWSYLLLSGILGSFSVTKNVYRIIIIIAPLLLTILVYLNLYYIDKKPERSSRFPKEIWDQISSNN